MIAAQVEWNGDPYYMGVIIAQNQNTKKNGYYFHDAVFVEAFDAGKIKIKTPGKLLSSGAANTTAPSLTKRIRILLQELARYNAKFGGNEFSDPEYLRAVENNDEETMARMVDEAARAAGYTKRVYGYSPEDLPADDLRFSYSTFMLAFGEYSSFTHSCLSHLGLLLHIRLLRVFTYFTNHFRLSACFFLLIVV